MRTRLAALSVGFVALTVLVGTGVTDGPDDAVLAALLPLRSAVLTNAFEIVTLLGSVAVTGALAIALALRFSAIEGRRGLVPLLLFAGLALEVALKQVVFQPGPPSELVHDSTVLFSMRDLTPFTYPSGQAMRLAFLASLVATRYPRFRVPLWFVVGLVAFGRGYLAAGWAADIVGGVLAGLALAALAELVADRAEGRRPAARATLISP